jgi:hypothetical protein
MPQVVNGILYPAVTLVINGQSITGSFYKFQVLASGSVIGGSAESPAHFRALRGANGVDLVPAGTGMFIPPGTAIEMQVTSASLDSTSAPVLFYS